LDNGRYPTQEEGLEALIFGLNLDPNHAKDWKERFWELRLGPNNVKLWNEKPYAARVREFCDGWGNLFIYRIPAVWSDEDYDVISYGRDGKPGGEGEDADIYNKN